MMSLLAHSPRFTSEQAAAFAARLYGVNGTAASLPSERDQNFAIQTHGEKFVLKIANALEKRLLLEAQNQVLAHLSSRVTFCPQVLPSLSGNEIESVDSGHHQSHFVRLVTCLPGVPLHECGDSSPALFESF